MFQPSQAVSRDRGKLNGPAATEGERVSQASPRGTFVIIAEALRTQLQGDQPPEALPSEAKLMKEYGVSRTTVRRALRVLADEGLVVSSPGVGWAPAVASVDRRPLVERITDVLRTDELREGDRFPSEAQLCERFGASRTAVRGALAQMEGKGLLKSTHGKGRTVIALPDAEPRP